MLKVLSYNSVPGSEHVRKKLWNLLTQFIQFHKTGQQIYLKKEQIVQKMLLPKM